MKTLSNSGKLLAPDGLIARKLGNYELRPQQVEMADAVDHALEKREHLLVEAGTGVGKTFAYLIPAIRRVTAHRECAVISTRTIALQEQLLNKDIPFLQSVMPCEFSAVLMKGRSNYVGLRRLQQASKRQELLFATSNLRRELWRIEDWATTTNDGTLSDLAPEPAFSVWDAAKSEHGNCMGRRCPNYEPCFYQRARRRAEHAQLLIVNHALFFADLALRARGAGVLPDYDFAILDEAHTIEGIAAEHLGIRVSDRQIRHLLNTLYNESSAGKAHGILTCCHADQAVHGVDLVRRCLQDFTQQIVQWHSDHGRSNGRLAVPLPVENTVSPALRSLASRLLAVRGRSTNESDRFELTSYVDRAVDLAGQVETLLNQDLQDWVYWLEVETDKRQRLSLCATPIDVSSTLKDALFSRVSSVILTSATLATKEGDDFEYIRTRIGLKQTGMRRFGSPFDFASQMTVHIEAWLPDPADHEAFVPAACEAIRRHIRETSGKALVLFTSYRLLNECAERLAAFFDEEGIPLMVQGPNLPRSMMLDRFREEVDSVIFGTDSFWEGIDVTGEALSNLIIVKLPFAVPSLPRVEARIERIRRDGQDPFHTYQLPEAVLKFRQGTGRLIRSIRDTGRIVVLDRRIVRKPYGRAFLDALPPCPVTINESPP